jgi:predicted methyltransferase
MNKTWTLAFAAASVLAAPSFAATHKMPASVEAAVSDSQRPAEDTKLDADRKPGEMLVIAKVKPGAKVMDLIPGGGYFTRLFSVAVGPKGYVYDFQPKEFDAFSKGKPPAILAVAAQYKNVSVIRAPLNDLAAPEALDTVWTSQNYHDIHDSFAKPADIAVVNKKIYDALKPGGLYVVLDHAAEKGSGLRDTETLHRIDEASVKQEVLAAGFKFVGRSSLLANPADPHTKLVFDPSIRHHTDQFILIFRKPGK